MLAVAERVIWFAPPEEALLQPYVFMAHLMTSGLPRDVVYVQRVMGSEAFQETLIHCPPGVFDARSWAYWHLVFGQPVAPPLPTRRF